MSQRVVRAMAASAVGEALQPIEYRLGNVEPDDVEIEVDYCGLCHSDLSMLDDEWGRSDYPLVPGHEVVGRISALGTSAKGLSVGDRVGLGWFSGCCLHCDQCMSGHHNLCRDAAETIVGRHGGFATHVRTHWAWAVPLPQRLESRAMGPLFCGGVTVFQPLVSLGIRPTDRVAVVGIGGLGHLAVQFLAAWGCEVTAMTTSQAKADDARSLGARYVISSVDKADLKAAAGQFDLVLVTSNVPLDWPRYLAALAPEGRLHVVGAVLEPMAIAAFGLIGGQKSVSGSPMGSPATIRHMLRFCERHGIQPQIEEFALSDINRAIDHLREGRARYRVVLKNDLGS